MRAATPRTKRGSGMTSGASARPPPMGTVAQVPVVWARTTGWLVNRLSVAALGLGVLGAACSASTPPSAKPAAPDATTPPRTFEPTTAPEATPTPAPTVAPVAPMTAADRAALVAWVDALNAVDADVAASLAQVTKAY